MEKVHLSGNRFLQIFVSLLVSSLLQKFCGSCVAPYLSYLDESPGQYFERKKQAMDSKCNSSMQEDDHINSYDYHSHSKRLVLIQIGFARKHTECREVHGTFSETGLAFLSRCA